MADVSLETPKTPHPEEVSASPAEYAEHPESTQHIAWLVAKSKRGPGDHFRYVLLLRFFAFNVAAVALVGAAYLQGLVELVVLSDRTGLCVAMAAIFLFGLVICGRRVLETSRELNRVREFNPLAPSRAGTFLAQLRGRSADSRSIYCANLRLKLSHRIAVVRHVANSLVILGLIGTVIGFIIALSGVDPRHVSDVEAIGPMVATLIDGMSVALYTTLVGAVLSLWLMVNYHMLASSTVKLINALIEFGEGHARP